MATVCQLVYLGLLFSSIRTQDLSSLAEITAFNSEAALSFNDPESAAKILDGFRFKRYVLAAALYDQNRKLFADYHANKTEVELPVSPRLSHGYTAEGGLGYFWQPVELNDETIGFLLIVFDKQDLHNTMLAALLVAALLLLGCLVLAFLLAGLLQKIVTQPIDELIAAINTIANSKDYSARVPENRGDEMGRLIADFNIMLSEIEARDHGLEAVVAKRTKVLETQNQIFEQLVQGESLQDMLSLLLQNLEQQCDQIVCALALYDSLT
ncbi:MAG: HAMP domain-containing protein, partial [Bdellovibrionales bacterium]|nr:HAMP domain-containing protein [Bdellovibrionales bacterium]